MELIYEKNEEIQERNEEIRERNANGEIQEGREEVRKAKEIIWIQRTPVHLGPRVQHYRECIRMIVC